MFFGYFHSFDGSLVSLYLNGYLSNSVFSWEVTIFFVTYVGIVELDSNTTMAFEKETDRRFVAQLTDNQGSLFSFLVGILGNVHDAQDALQDTNLLLLSKMANFEEGTNFGAWSRSCARFVALSQIRDRGRDPHRTGAVRRRY